MTPAELRRLLELAARAAGYTTTHNWNAARMRMTPPVVALVAHCDGDLVSSGWNPADNDGDGARLEAALGLDVAWHRMGVVVTYRDAEGHDVFGHDAVFREAYADQGGDKQRARRLAVLRAAAAIGEAMP